MLREKAKGTVREVWKTYGKDKKGAKTRKVSSADGVAYGYESESRKRKGGGSLVLGLCRSARRR